MNDTQEMQEYVIVLSEDCPPYQADPVIALISETLPDIPAPVRSGDEVYFKTREMDEDLEKSICNRPCVKSIEKQ